MEVTNLDNFGCSDVYPETDTCHVEHTITGLDNSKSYFVDISSHNGVSDQNLENAHLRIVRIQGRTADGCKCDVAISRD